MFSTASMPSRTWRVSRASRTSWGPAFARYVERNIMATQRLLEAVARLGPRPFVYASSSSVYGTGGDALRARGEPRPKSPYGVSKLAAEALVGAYSSSFGIPAVSLRYFSVYGPRQRPDMAAHRFIESMLDGRPITVFGDGSQVRDYSYVGDVVDATIRSLSADLPPAAVLDIASGNPVDVRTLIAHLQELLSARRRDRRAGRRASRRRAADVWTNRPGAGTAGLVPQDGAAIGSGSAGRLAHWPQTGPAGSGQSIHDASLASFSGSRPMSGSSSPRLVVYSQDGLGLGHQRRTTLLASEFLAAKAGASVLTISDSPLGQFFPTSVGHDYLKLPSIHKVGPGDWRPLSLSLSFAEVLEVRREIIRSAVLKFAPDVVLVDHMPHGAMGELVPTLEALQGSGTRIVLGLRDILDSPAVVRQRWHLEGAFEAVEQYFHDVLVYGSRDVFDMSVGIRLAGRGQPAAALLRLRLLAVHLPSGADKLRRRYLRNAADSDLIVAMAGGGADADGLFETLLSAVPAINAERPCVVVIVTGPFLPRAEQRKLTRLARGLPVHVIRTVNDSLTYLSAADLVIAMAGYNTTAEILTLDKPALLVPRSGPSAEQQMRAKLFADRGWVNWLPPAELSPDTLAEAALSALTTRRRRTSMPGPPGSPCCRAAPLDQAGSCGQQWQWRWR